MCTAPVYRTKSRDYCITMWLSMPTGRSVLIGSHQSRGLIVTTTWFGAVHRGSTPVQYTPNFGMSIKVHWWSQFDYNIFRSTEMRTVEAPAQCTGCRCSEMILPCTLVVCYELRCLRITMADGVTGMIALPFYSSCSTRFFIKIRLLYYDYNIHCWVGGSLHLFIFSPLTSHPLQYCCHLTELTTVSW